VGYFEVTLPPQELIFNRFNFASTNDPIGGFVIGDFNLDGKLDVAFEVQGRTSASLGILLGNGDGTFSKPKITKIPYGSGTILTADFNQDGIPDLVLADGIFNRIYVLLGKGDGTFRTLAPAQMDQSPNLMAVGDFNGDGKIDLATSNTNDNSVSILLGSGDGSFQSSIDILGLPTPFEIAVGDFNKDGKLDIGVTEYGSAITILTGNGDGTFAIGNTYATANPALSIAAADVNGDGKLDLVVVNGANSQAGDPEGDWEVFLGNGDGTFQSGIDYSPGGGFLEAVVADVNGDGKPDVVATGGPYGSYAGTLAMFLGNGDGTFQQPISRIVGQAPSSLMAGDLNGDGRLDLIFEDIGSPSSLSGLIQVPATLTPKGLSFGKVALGSSSVSETVTLTNVGGPALGLSSVTVGGSNPGDFAPADNCPTNLASGASCDISVTFKPTALGPRSAGISVSFSGGAIPQGFTVKGTGTSAVQIAAAGGKP